MGLELVNFDSVDIIKTQAKANVCHHSFYGLMMKHYLIVFKYYNFGSLMLSCSFELQIGLYG